MNRYHGYGSINSNPNIYSHPTIEGFVIFRNNNSPNAKLFYNGDETDFMELKYQFSNRFAWTKEGAYYIALGSKTQEEQFLDISYAGLAKGGEGKDRLEKISHTVSFEIKNPKLYSDDNINHFGNNPILATMYETDDCVCVLILKKCFLLWIDKKTHLLQKTFDLKCPKQLLITTSTILDFFQEAKKDIKEPTEAMILLAWTHQQLFEFTGRDNNLHANFSLADVKMNIIGGNIELGM